MDNIAYIIQSKITDNYLSDAADAFWSEDICNAQLFNEKSLERYMSVHGEKWHVIVTVKITIV